MWRERTIKYNEGRPPQKITPVALDSGAPSLQPVTADAQALVSPVAAAAAAVGGAAPRLASPPSTAARLWQSSPPPPRPLRSAATVRNAAAAALAATPARRLRASQQGHAPNDHGVQVQMRVQAATWPRRAARRRRGARRAVAARCCCSRLRRYRAARCLPGCARVRDAAGVRPRHEYSGHVLAAAELIPAARAHAVRATRSASSATHSPVVTWLVRVFACIGDKSVCVPSARIDERRGGDSRW